jgi:hypothetical protein
MFKQILKSYTGKIESFKIEGYDYHLVWLTDLGIGHLESNGYDYGEDYWEIYQKYAHNDVGVKLTQARADFVTENGGSFDDLCDVGVGSGQFVDTVKCKGTDVNEIANAWLNEHGYYVEDPTTFKSLTLWDVIEHIEDPASLLVKAENVFISTPIYQDSATCLKSKHLKPGEHIWYFTESSLSYFMGLLGFKLVASSDCESQLGRESILSFYFKRK